MKRKILLDALGAMDWAVAAKPIVEEMGCYRICGKTLRTTDGALLVQAELAETTGLDCTVPAAGLKALLKDLGDDDVVLKIDGNKLAVATDRVRGRFALATGPGVLDDLSFDADEWRPVTPALKEAVRRCRFAASGDSAAGAYTGVLVGEDYVIATDKVRIAWFKVKAGKARRKPAGGDRPKATPLSAEPVVLPAELAAVMDRHADAVEEWAVAGGTVYLRGGGVTWGAQLLQGKFTEKAVWYVGESDKMGERLELPADTDAIVRRHLDQQSEVMDMDREVELEVDGTKMTVRSTDGVRYELEETVALPTEAGRFVFAIHPQCLLDTLATTHTMRYDPSTVEGEKGEACPVFPFVAFVHDGDQGEFRYLATVEVKNG